MERGGEGKEERQYPQLCLLPEPSVQGCPALKDGPNPSFTPPAPAPQQFSQELENHH